MFKKFKILFFTHFKSGKINKLDAKIINGICGFTGGGIKYKPPLIKKDQTTQGFHFFSDEIKQLAF